MPSSEDSLPGIYEEYLTLLDPDGQDHAEVDIALYALLMWIGGGASSLISKKLTTNNIESNVISQLGMTNQRESNLI
jgi:hypothetical protein